MKKIVLILSLCLLSTIGMAQVIFYVESPSPNEGNYDLTFATATGTAPWGVADLEDPINSVLAEMVLIEDGSGLTNPTACATVTNDLTGKIAVLYRGSCEFGSKALRAQSQGAVAVIIINNLGGSPVAMGGGDDGGAVTIPTIMISDVTGALLRDEINAGATEVFIGSKNGLYENDLGMTLEDYLRPTRFGNLQLLSQNASEFEVGLGSWVRNYGSGDQTGVVLNVTVGTEGSILYNETSAGVSIPSGDSAYIDLPTFSQETYANGYYNVVYTVSSSEVDESDFDNIRNADFNMSDDIFSMARLDQETSIPVHSTSIFETVTRYDCLFLEDENASRMGVLGMSFSAGTSQNPEPTSLDGQVVELFVYEWNDTWVDMNDGGFDISLLDDIANTDYVYAENLQEESVYVEFDESLLLEDDQRYLFCIQTYGTGIYLGYDVETHYALNIDTYAQPQTVVFRDNWFGGGSSLGQPSISVKMFDANSIGLVELPQNELLDAYPNPAVDIIHIPVQLIEGNVAMTIVDINGRIIDNQNVFMSTGQLDVDVSAFATGQYIINLEFANGEKKSINVVVTK